MAATTTPLLTGRVDTSWHAKAACRYESADLIRPETDPLFHPANERASEREARDERAKAICAGCPVKLTCRDDARARREAYGVWGGESEAERAAWLAGVRDRPRRRPAENKPPRKNKSILDGAPCQGCGTTMRTRRKARSKVGDLADGEAFHAARGLCEGCYRVERRIEWQAAQELERGVNAA